MDLAPCSPSILDLSEIIWYHESFVFEKVFFFLSYKAYHKGKSYGLLAQLRTYIMQGSSSYSNLDTDSWWHQRKVSKAASKSPVWFLLRQQLPPFNHLINCFLINQQDLHIPITGSVFSVSLSIITVFTEHFLHLEAHHKTKL